MLALAQVVVHGSCTRSFVSGLVEGKKTWRKRTSVGTCEPGRVVSDSLARKSAKRRTFDRDSDGPAVTSALLANLIRLARRLEEIPRPVTSRLRQDRKIVRSPEHPNCCQLR